MAEAAGENPVPKIRVNILMVFEGPLRGEGLLAVGAAKHLPRIAAVSAVGIA